MTNKTRITCLLSIVAALSCPALYGLIHAGQSSATPPGADAGGEVPPINGMVYIPPGEFIMGSSAEDIKKGADMNEFPQRKVFVDGFYIDIYEVTNIQYKIFVDSMHAEPPSHWIDGSYPVGMDGYPVVGISWYDAARYAAFVGKRLPTEEEWEKAARGTDGRKFPWGDSFDGRICNNGSRLAPVGSFPGCISPYGVFDMAGNAAEWVDAWYAPYPRDDSNQWNPDDPEFKPRYGDRKYRVYRGGSWNNFGKYLRCARRGKAKPAERWNNIGFRCAKDPPWKND